MHFSIVTITKNNSLGFEKTRKSVQSQTYKNYEWIVVDGDKEPDNGIYDAMNKGIDRSQGTYIIFMNSGDQFASKNTLEETSKLDADFIYGDAIEGGVIKKSKHYLKINSGMITHHQSMIYKRSVIGALRYDERYKLASDYKFTIEFIKKSKAFSYINTPLCIFELGGISQQNSKASRLEEKLIRQEFKFFSPLTPFRQYVAQLIKKYFPNLYFKIRKII